MNTNLCEKCQYQRVCKRMQNAIRQVFYCFTFYDNVDKRKKKCNFSCLASARSYRNQLKLDKVRYSKISDIFEDSLDL